MLQSVYGKLFSPCVVALVSSVSSGERVKYIAHERSFMASSSNSEIKTHSLCSCVCYMNSIALEVGANV